MCRGLSGFGTDWDRTDTPCQGATLSKITGSLLNLEVSDDTDSSLPPHFLLPLPGLRAETQLQVLLRGERPQLWLHPLESWDPTPARSHGGVRAGRTEDQELHTLPHTGLLCEGRVGPCALMQPFRRRDAEFPALPRSGRPRASNPVHLQSLSPCGLPSVILLL